MGERVVRYFFGRLNLIGSFTDKRSFVLRGLESRKVFEYRGYNWGFFEINEIKNEMGDFIHGFLVKYKLKSEEEVAVPNKHKLTLESIANRVIAKSRFFLHVETSVIAYHPVGNQIVSGVFCERFARIFEKNHEGFFVNAEIQIIEEQYKIFEAIKRFSSIRKVSISLNPSNPSNIDRWRKIDERLKRLGALKYHEEYEGNPDVRSLDVEKDEEVISKISMAEDGYGRADVSGAIEGESKTISTRDNPITAVGPRDDEPADSVLGKLSQTLKKILRRFK